MILKKKIKIYCVTDKVLNYFKKLPYIFAGVGKRKFPKNYLLSNKFINIHYKEKNYSELTFHYWFWKNMLKKIDKNTWIGFCQKRRFWLKKDSIQSKVNINNLNKNIINFFPKEWNRYESVISEPIFVNNMKKMKILKRGLRSLIKDPEILLLDDCLSAVDTETEEIILSNLKEYCKNKTTIIVSNRVSSAKNADNIIIIEDGAIIQQGPHNQLVNEEGYYKELYLKQLSEKDLK